MTLEAVTRRALLTAGSGFLLSACASNYSASMAALNHQPAARLPGSHQIDMRDPHSGLIWRIFVQVPEQPPLPAGYPVLYVLDGNACFFLAAQLANNTTNRPPHLRPAPLMVVGIGHPVDTVMDQAGRKRDYTPPPATEEGTGGADVFLEFIQNQLQPAINASWPIDTARQTVFGHSLGGLLVIHAMLSRTRLFTQYAAASPSLWWNDAQVMGSMEQWIARHSLANSLDTPTLRLQLRVGSLERDNPSDSAQRAAKRVERRMAERVQEFAQRFSALGWPHLLVDYAELSGLDHGRVLAPALIESITLAQRDAI